MADKYGIKKLQGFKGIVGPIFLTNGNVPLRDDDGQILYMKNKRDVPITGFYTVKADIDGSLFKAVLIIQGFKSKISFLRHENPIVTIKYDINDAAEILDSNDAVATPGTFSQYFAKDVVKVAGNWEQSSAIDLVLSLTGSSIFQQNFPVSFSSVEGFSVGTITLTNINDANAQ